MHAHTYMQAHMNMYFQSMCDIAYMKRPEDNCGS